MRIFEPIHSHKSRDSTNKIITLMLSCAGNDFLSAQQLLECLWAYEEWKSEKRIDSDADFVARAESLRRGTRERFTPGANTLPENSEANDTGGMDGHFLCSAA